MLLPRSAAALLLAFAVGTSLAVNLVYDEVLWTKQMWSQAKFRNPLQYTNPSDQDPKLLEVYPSIKGTMANSLDGPHERRDATQAPADAEETSDLTGLTAIDDTSHVKPAAQAAKCSVCHVLVAKLWQNFTEQVAEGIPGGPAAMLAISNQLVGPEGFKQHVAEVCKDQATDSLLASQSVLRLGDATGTIMFFVIRDRRKGSSPTEAEVKAVRLACKNLVVGSGEDIAKEVADSLSKFMYQLDKVLKKREPEPSDGSPDRDQGAEATRAQALFVRGVKLALQNVGAAADQAASKSAAAAAAGGGDDDDDDDEEDDEDTDPDCMDLHPMCQQWADSGECEANPVYMVGNVNHKGHCRKSCGVCIPKNRELSGTEALSREVEAKHPGLVAEVERLAKPLLESVRSLACAASQACLAGVAGTAMGGGFTKIAEAMQQQQQQQSGGWQLGTQFYGRANIEKLSSSKMKDLEASEGHAPAEPGSVAAEVDTVLVEELKGKVLSVPGDFFIFEYLYKNHTRHYHVDGQGKYTEDYILGNFQRESATVLSAATGGAAMLEERDLLPSLRTLMMQKEWPYVKQVYAGGDECILGGGRRSIRKTEARIACSPDGKLHMLVREPDFCQYIFVIYSPSLCKVERFKPASRGVSAARGGQRKAEDDDDEYL